MGLLADMRRASQESQELEEYRSARAAQREQDIYNAGAVDAEDRIYQGGLAGQLGGAPVQEPGYKERFVNWLQSTLLGGQESTGSSAHTWRNTRAGAPLDQYIKEQGL